MVAAQLLNVCYNFVIMNEWPFAGDIQQSISHLTVLSAGYYF